MPQPWLWVKVTERSSSTFPQTHIFFVPNIKGLAQTVLTWEGKVFVAADADAADVAEMNWKHKVTPDRGDLMMVRLPMHICITQAQWVKTCWTHQSLHLFSYTLKFPAKSTKKNTFFKLLPHLPGVNGLSNGNGGYFGWVPALLCHHHWLVIDQLSCIPLSAGENLDHKLHIGAHKLPVLWQTSSITLEHSWRWMTWYEEV